MSKYIHFDRICFTSQALLLAALSDLGYADVEVGERLPLYGYQGDRRPETADVVLRRQHIGRASNDIGFARSIAGLVPIVSEYDQQTLFGGQFLVKLRTAYSERAVEELRRRLNGTVQRTVQDKLVRIRLRY